MAASIVSKVIDYMIARREVRVRRDGIVKFFAVKSGGFLALPVYSEAELSPEAKARGTVKGWTVPASEYGRNADRPADVSMRNSIAAWIKDRALPAIAACGGATIAPEAVAIHLEGYGEDARIVIYRKG